LERNSGHLFTLLTMERYIRRYDGGRETLEEMIQWVDTRPSTWIMEQPLYQALAEGSLKELRSR
jgi:non-ribosomal peptide synthetase component F